VKENQAPLTRPADYDPTLYNALASHLGYYPETRLKKLFGVISRGNGKTGFNTSQHGAPGVSLGALGLNRDYPDADYAKRKEIYDFYKLYTKGLYYFLGNDPRVPDSLRKDMLEYGYAKDEYIDNENFPYYLYIREARRMQSDYVFTEHDILKTREKEDAVLLGSHWIDCHTLRRVAISDTSYINEGNIWHKVTEPFEIPYRIIVPSKDECTNLLVPVCLSATHVGFSSIRLEPTWMQLGHAASTAACMAIEQSENVQELIIYELQDSLRSEGMIVTIDELNK
jgi:hypothetical protein